jgi:hypothetical protein
MGKSREERMKSSITLDKKLEMLFCEKVNKTKTCKKTKAKFSNKSQFDIYYGGIKRAI